MKKLISILLAAALFCTLFSGSAFAIKSGSTGHDWEDMRAILIDFNDLCANYYVYTDDDVTSFIEIEGDITNIKATRYDFALMRISRLYFDDGFYFYWNEHESPYYVLLISYNNEWTVDGVVYVDGKAFSYVGSTDSWYIDHSKYEVYWSK